MNGTWRSGERGWNLLGWVICALQVLTLTAIAVRDEVDPTRLWPCAGTCAAGVLILGPVLLVRSRSDLTFPTIIWPIVGTVFYASFGLIAPEVTAPLPGMLTICFVYIGLTQRRWTSCWFLILAVPAYIIGAGGVDVITRSTLLLLVVMWLFIAEVPAALLERLRQQSEQLALMARTDSLTGLLNRSVLVDELAMTSPADTVVMIDLDGFKKYNDEFGHVSGDTALADLARALVTRTHARWFRYGGDEFVGIFADSSAESVRSVVDAVRASTGAERTPIAFSAGCAPGGPQALERADADLYRVKASRSA